MPFTVCWVTLLCNSADLPELHGTRQSPCTTCPSPMYLGPESHGTDTVKAESFSDLGKLSNPWMNVHLDNLMGMPCFKCNIYNAKNLIEVDHCQLFSLPHCSHWRPCWVHRWSAILCHFISMVGLPYNEINGLWNSIMIQSHVSSIMIGMEKQTSCSQPQHGWDNAVMIYMAVMKIHV